MPMSLRAGVGRMAGEEKPAGMHPSFVGVIRQKERIREKLSGIKHKIGVYSAKGGVGKTTVSVNLAYALAKMGFKVGILDADIDTPNVSLFLGIGEKMDTSSMPLKPLVKEGVKIASTGMIATEDNRPIIWRGPMMVKMLGEFFENTDWGDLDYMILDLPPGSSDSPLTIMQVLGLEGFVIVTTPQRISSVNSIRSGLMAKRLNVPVLGIIENMSNGMASAYTEAVSKALDAPVIGSVNYDARFNEMSDSGKVPVLEDEGIFGNFRQIAAHISDGNNL